MKKILLGFTAGLLVCCTAVAQRLPGGASPSHYSLAVNINFPTNTFDGDETIDLTLTKPGNTITLNAVEIEFHQVTVTAGGQTQTAKVALYAGSSKQGKATRASVDSICDTSYFLPL